MSAKKLNTVSTSKSVSFKITSREAWFVIQHAQSGAYAPDNVAESMSFQQMLSDLGVLELYQQYTANLVDPAQVRSLMASEEQEDVELSAVALDMFLGKFTEGKMAPAISVHLIPVIQRARAARNA